jgi:hypothetical protein
MMMSLWKDAPPVEQPEVIEPRRNLDNESLPSNTSEHCHLADRNGTLLGHLEVDRELIPNPSMVMKNTAAD